MGAVSRVALVTGAASGIGRATARHLADRGLEVVSVDRDPIDDAPGPAIAYDLEDVEGLEGLLTQAEEAAGPVDVLVNNAAMFVSTPVSEISVDQIRRTLAVNLMAPVMLAALAGRGMRKRGWGRIVFISSIKDRFGERGSLAYDASKGGVSQATRTLAVELGGDGVLVNAIAPGYVRTGMSVIDGENELESDWFKANYIESGRLPVGRAAEPEEIAVVVGWLASEANAYVNGTVVRADGGLSSAL
jgi:NAD(P)-dependent dehydrogenase (short-subunit alcohol dehydrogenase family)